MAVLFNVQWHSATIVTTCVGMFVEVRSVVPATPYTVTLVTLFDRDLFGVWMGRG